MRDVYAFSTKKALLQKRNRADRQGLEPLLEHEDVLAVKAIIGAFVHDLLDDQ